MSFSPITLPIFSQLLEPDGIAPSQNFEESGELICSQIPDEQIRAKVRFIIGEIVRFKLGGDDEVRKLSKYWRAELSPRIEGEEADIFVSGFEDDEGLTDLASEAPIIRLVNHLFARSLDLNSSDIHFEPNEIHLLSLIHI